MTIINRSLSSEPNIVPLCDILLVLLIIFMIITPMMQTGIDTKLPNEGESGSGVFISIDKDYLLYINNTPIKVDNLEDELRRTFDQRLDKTVFVTAHRQCRYQQVINILDLCRKIGIQTIGIVNPDSYRLY